MRAFRLGRPHPPQLYVYCVLADSFACMPRLAYQLFEAKVTWYM